MVNIEGDTVIDQIGKAIEEIQNAKSYTDWAIKEQMKVWRSEPVESQPLLLKCPLSAEEKAAFPKHSYKDIHYDSRKNFEYHIPGMLAAVRGGAGAVPSSRANMGCGIYAAFFGLTQTLYDDKMPWLMQHLKKEEIKNIDIKDIKLTDEFKTGLGHMEYLAEALKDTGARVYPMDLQGPVDLAHLVYGDDFFYDLYDDIDLIEHLMTLCTQAINIGSKACLDIIPGSSEAVAHYSETIMPKELGGIKTSEDTSTLLSKEHVKNIAMKYTEKVLEFAGGGYVHYCGKNDHLLEAVLSCDIARGLNFGNPEMQDIEYILKRCADSGKILYSSVAKGKEEPWHEYFYRLLKASYKDGKFHLLLSLSCQISERDDVLYIWKKAQDDVRNSIVQTKCLYSASETTRRGNDL